jgi:hypothetical protein
VVTKKGTGKAVLAQLRAQSVDTCTAAPVLLQDLPIGTPCAVANGGVECKSGVCCQDLCAECCADTRQVSTGVTGGDAGTVHDVIVPCPNGGTCKQVASGARDLFLPAVPPQCDPEEGKAPSKAECIVNTDCASGVCNGATITFWNLDGDAGVAGCQPSFPDAGPDCLVSAVRGGVCQ